MYVIVYINVWIALNDFVELELGQYRQWESKLWRNVNEELFFFLLHLPLLLRLQTLHIVHMPRMRLTTQKIRCQHIYANCTVPNWAQLHILMVQPELRHRNRSGK